MNFFIVFLPPLLSQEECQPCLPGYYCAAEGLLAPSGRCREGFFCLEGADRPDPPSRDSRGGPCPEGTRNTGLDDRSSRADHLLRSTIKKRPFKPSGKASAAHQLDQRVLRVNGAKHKQLLCGVNTFNASLWRTSACASLSPFFVFT